MTLWWLSLLYPRGLMLVLLIPFYRWIVSRKSRHLWTFSGYHDMVRIFHTHSLARRTHHLLVSLLLATFSIVLTYPHTNHQHEKINEEGIDIVLALDVSSSMLATDLDPHRLASAKDVLQQFIDDRVSDRIGLVVFAGKPFTSVPLTFDYGILTETVTTISTETINQRAPWLQWTAIGDAILNASAVIDSWKDEEQTDAQREQIIILLTDGEANQWVDPIVAAKFAQEHAIKIYTVGIWSLAWWFIELPSIWWRQRHPVPWVDEETLQAIAATTQGEYFRATDNDSLQRIFETINQLERSEIETEIQQIRQPFVWPFVTVLIVLTFVLISEYMEA